MTVAAVEPSVVKTLIGRLEDIVGPDGLINSQAELLVYECDGYTLEKNRPDVVVVPTTTEQVVSIVKLCQELRVPFLPRGSGTSLAGARFT